MAELNIMIVDDDALVVSHLQKTLKKLGYSVTGIFASGEEAVEAYDQQKPDVIIMDIKLRDHMSGIDAAKLIHEKSEIPILFITAYSDDAVIKEASMTGPFGFLVKPVNERELKANIEMSLYKSILNKQLKNLNKIIYAVREVNKVITKEKDIQKIIDETSRILVERRNFQMVWIGLRDAMGEDFSRTTIFSGIEKGKAWTDQFFENRKRWPGFFSEVLKSGVVKILQKSVESSEKGPWKNALNKLEVKSLCAVPIGIENEVLGALCVFASEEDAFNQEEVDLLNELANDVDFSIRKIREEEGRLAAEKAFRESDMLLRHIISQTGQLIYDYDVDLGRIKWFGALEEILGVTGKEYDVRGVSDWEDRIHPEDKDQALLALEKAIKEVSYYSVEYRFQHDDGSYHDMEDTGVVISGTNGHGLRMIGTMKNITEKRQTEEALHKSEERFRLMFLEAPLPYQALDPKGVILDVNVTWLNLLGYERSEVIGKPFRQFLTAESGNSFQRGFLKLLEKGELISVMDMVQKNGSTLVIELAGRASYNSTGEINRTHWILKDITEQVQVERELMDYKDRLEKLVLERTASLDRTVAVLNATLESTPDGILVTDLEGRIVNLNNRFLSMTGSTREQLMNNSFNIFLQQEASGFKDPGTVAVLQEMVKSSNAEGRVEFNMKDGRILDCYTFPQKEDDVITGVVWTFSDITERKKIEEELTQAKIQAEMASRAKSEFLANMSHEIRTPMNAVIGFADLLDRKVEQPELKNYVRSIRSSGHALLHIINDVLDISKIEAGRMEIHMEPFRLQTVFTEIENIFSMKIAEKMLKFSLEIPEDFPFAVIIDELRLQQVLMNIIGNAIKFTEKGGITVKASWARKSVDSISLRIDVTDTGIGIDPENQKRIFQAFMQQNIQDQKKYGGTGLGLFISKRFMELMGGTIDVSGKPGVGSTFSLVFDEVKTYEKKLKSEEEESGIDYNALWFDNQIVLIVDDVETNRNLVKSMLSDCNLVILEAQNGLEAVKMAKIYRPDLIFMDIRMPVMDGFVATKQIKEDPDLKRIPVVALTASIAEVDTEQENIEAAFDGYLRKPVLLSDVRGELIKFLDFNEKKPETVIEAGIPAKSTTFEVSETKRADLDSKIRNEILPLWEQLTKRISMQDTEALANLILQTGEKFQVDGFILFGEELKALVNAFDVVQIKTQLMKFPVLLEEGNLLNK